MRNRKQNTDTYMFWNANPKSIVSSTDCVPRAISTATGLTWEESVRGLTETGIKLHSVLNDKKVFDAWLQENGWMKHKQPRKPNNRKYTAAEFCKLYPKGTYVINLANHLSCVQDGTILDTWNCGFLTVGNYWTKA